MKKIFTLFLLAVCACLNAAAQFVPEDGKQYVIKDARSDFYIVLAVGNDSQASDSDNTTQASLGVTGTPFTFTPSGSGFILSTDDGKYLGCSSSRAWNVKTDVDDTVWYIYDYEATNGRCRIYKNASQGLGLDNHTIGSGVYTDKPNQYWQIEEYAAPEEVHTVVATVDGVEYTMLEDGEGGYIVTVPEVATGEHSVTVSYDGEETTETFTTSDYKVFDSTVSVGKVTVHYKDGVITVTGDGIKETVSYPPLYVLGFDNVWNPAEPSMTVQASEDGTYTFSFDVDNYYYFTVGTALGADKGDWETFNANRLGCPGNEDPLFTGSVFELTRGVDHSFSLSPGHWSFLVNIDEMTLTVLEGKNPDVIYVLGIDGNWNPAKPSLTVEADKEGNFTFKYEVTEKAWFALGTKLGANSEDWEGFNANRLGAPEADYPLYKEDVVYFEHGKDSSFAIEPGYWVFSVNQKKSKISVIEGVEKVTDGIQNVATQASAVIYDMQGRRVRNAEKGVYIVNGTRVIK